MRSKILAMAAMLALASCGDGHNQGSPALREVALLAGAIDAGGRGDRDGIGAAARFAEPDGMAVDAPGNLLVVDAGNQKLKRISADGAVSTVLDVAQLPRPINASGQQTQYEKPTQVAVGPDGHYYLAVQQIVWPRPLALGPGMSAIAGSWVALRVAPTGEAKVYADPLQQPEAALSAGSVVRSLAFDSRGQLYVADISTCSIRRIDRQGVISTVVVVSEREGGHRCRGFDSLFFGVAWLTVDHDDSLFYGLTNGEVRRRSAGGTDQLLPVNVPSSFIGGGAAIDAQGRLLLVDRSRHRVLTLMPTGTAVILAQLDDPAGVAVGRDGTVFVADAGNHTIRRIAADGGVSTIAGLAEQVGFADGPGATARFGQYFDVAADAAGVVYVADGWNAVVRRIADGVVSTLAGAVGSRGTVDGANALARFEYPASIAASAAGKVFVYDREGVRKLKQSGMVSTPWPHLVGLGAVIASNAAGDLYESPGIIAFTIDGSGPNYVRVIKLGADGTRQTVLATTTDKHPALASVGYFGPMRGLAAADDGSFYFTLGNAVFKQTADGALSLLAGDGTGMGSRDGQGASARFNQPAGLALDGAGNVFVADYGNHTVRKITPEGAVSTVLGIAGKKGNLLGAVPGGLESPTSVAVVPGGLVIGARLAVLIARP